MGNELFGRPAQIDPPIAESGARGPTVGSQPCKAVPVPVLCKDFVRQNGETRLVVDMKSITDPSPSVPAFPVKLQDGHEILEASLSEGMMLTVRDTSETKRMIARSSSTSEKALLFLYDGLGAFCGKITSAPDGNGVLVYYLQAPCAIVRATDLSGIHIDIKSITDRRNVIGRSFRKNQELRFQVAHNYDVAFMVACLLGIIMLQPTLMELSLQRSSYG
mmetsp:Transcript_55350/g.103853  ORF Transcript_55350/g.103853 Transcript_55350/m.103853 type:complete len:219 (+) Transcript_55350:47-703(+)